MNNSGSFALIVSTVDRMIEIETLFASLCEQTYRHFRVILVDQNTDGRLHSLVEEYSSRISILHLSSGRGLSKGRNVGLDRIGDASFVAFPDDDCVYPRDVLQKVAADFDAFPRWDVVTGRSITASGVESNNRWHQISGPVRPENVWNRATSFTIFARAAAVRNLQFDESLGIGSDTPWGSAEDVDFVLQLLRRKRYVFFDRKIAVQHPEWTSTGYNRAAYRKAASYARGMGRVLRKHGYPLHNVGYHLVRPLGGGLLALLSGRAAKTLWHWSMFTGRVQGWATPLDVLPSDPAPVATEVNLKSLRAGK